VSTPPPPPPAPEFAPDQRQEEILELLELIGPEPVAYFSDACRIMSGATGLVSQTHLAAHLLREIEGRLHEVFQPMLSREARRRIAEADEDKQSHRVKIQAAAEILDLDESTTEQWLEYALELHRFAHRYALSGPRDVAEFRTHFDLGQSVLLSLLRRYRTVYTQARPILLALAATRNPTDGHLKRLRRRVPHSTVALGEFFQLADTSWFDLLRGSGYFDDPPALEVDEEGRVTHVEWPAARFLVRAAAVEELQPQVAEIFAGLETNNPEARDAALEAALAMPAAMAATLVDKIAVYVRDAEFWWAPRHAEDLVDHLLAGGELAAALTVTKELIAAAPRGADWRMRHALTDLVPKLFPAVGIEGLEMLRDALLADLVEEGRAARNDYSTIWRPAIEYGPDHRRRELLVSAIASAAARIVEDDPTKLGEVARLVAEPEPAIFTRIALHTIAQHPDPEVAATWLGNEELFRGFSSEREYNELAAAAFANVPSEMKERVLTWIDDGPDWRPDDLAENDVAEFEDKWRRKQLRRLPDLPPERQEQYDVLVERFGEPADPLEPPGRAIWSGTTSPKTKEELLALEDAQLLEFLATWQPGDDWRGPSREGLAQELKATAAAEPSRLAALLPALASGEPSYARAVVDGLEQASRDGNGFAWEPMFRFAHDIARLPGEIEGRDPAGDLDQGWQPVRRSLAGLILYATEHGRVPREQADELLAVIAALAEDEDPRLETEVRRAGEGLGPTFGAINSVRGIALHAAVGFAWWLRPKGEGEDPDRHMPDAVREILERHLGPEREPTLTVHSVFGRHFNQLYFLDRAWTTEKLQLIFPDDPAQGERRDAAWRSFIEANQVWTASWPILEPQYARAIEQFADYDAEAPAEVSFFEPTGRLLVNLLVAFLFDLVELGDASLLGRFFAVAPLNLRTGFIELIGNDLSGSDDVAEETIEKLQRLWLWRSERVIAEGNVSELAGFAYWFGSGKLPERWALEELIRVLEAGAPPAFGYAVTHRLPELVEAELPLVMRVVSLLVERAYTPHMVISARDEFRTVLVAALASENEAVVREARETISRLYAQRHTEFNDLL
jgi:hypothetical protein